MMSKKGISSQSGRGHTEYRLDIIFPIFILQINKLNERIYWHSAPLPVITKNKDNEAEVIMKKFKKYPAVTLHEDINPTPAYWIENGFSPVILDSRKRDEVKLSTA